MEHTNKKLRNNKFRGIKILEKKNKKLNGPKIK
jgi:hypothetical protein